MYTLSSCLMYHTNLSRILLFSGNRQMLFCCIPVHWNAMHYGCYLEFALNYIHDLLMTIVISVLYLVNFLIKILNFWIKFFPNETWNELESLAINWALRRHEIYLTWGPLQLSAQWNTMNNLSYKNLSVSAQSFTLEYIISQVFWLQ